MAQLTPSQVGDCATWLSIVSQLYTSRMNALLEPHDMTLAQLSILNHVVRLGKKSGCRISDIAKAVQVGQPAVTKAVGKFQNQGLVELTEDRQDKRVRYVVALPKASKTLAQVQRSLGADLTELYSSLDSGHIGRFAGDLKQLGVWLDQNRLS